MDPLMKMVVGWTLVGGFVFTMVVTCLSLVGWVKFANPSQQKQLFAALVLELAVGVGGAALDMLRFDVADVGREVRGSSKLAGATELGRHLMKASPDERTQEAVLDALDALELPASAPVMERRTQLLESLHTARSPSAFSDALRAPPTLRVTPGTH